MMATELEFFLFEKSFDDMAQARASATLTPISGYNEDYHILQTTKEEDVMRPVRNGLFAAGIPVENTKGEAETGQEELNIRYSREALDWPTITPSPSRRSRRSPGPMAVRHVPAEVAPRQGRLVIACAPVAVERQGGPSSAIRMATTACPSDAPLSWPA
jgi:hypothetical protein